MPLFARCHELRHPLSSPLHCLWPLSARTLCRCPPLASEDGSLLSDNPWLYVAGLVAPLETLCPDEPAEPAVEALREPPSALFPTSLSSVFAVKMASVLSLPVAASGIAVGFESPAEPLVMDNGTGVLFMALTGGRLEMPVHDVMLLASPSPDEASADIIGPNVTHRRMELQSAWLLGAKQACSHAHWSHGQLAFRMS